MEDKDLLERLRLHGLTIADADNAEGYILECGPSYRNNFGLHFVKGDNFEAILLKGVYKDFLRIIKGHAEMNDAEWNEVAKLLNDAEVAAESPLNMRIVIRNGNALIISASISEAKSAKSADMRDYKIPRPLTSAEYALPASKLEDESVMLSAGFMGSIFQETMSPFAVSVLEKIPNVLNPIFTSCNLKTSSPSAVPVYGRAMINVNALEKMFTACGIGNAVFRASFATNLYLKQQTEPKQLNKSYFPIEQEEITELLEDIRRTIPHITAATLVEDSFLDYPVKLAICAEYVFIKLSDGAAKLYKYFSDFSNMLSAVFKTRENSLFFRKEPLNLPMFLDFSADSVPVSFSCEKPQETIGDFIKKLPFSRRFGASGKIEKIITEMHKLLDMRDEIYLAACSFVEKSKQALGQIADFGVKKGRLKSPDEIYLLEHSDVRRVYFDSFFGETSRTISFHRWVADRYAAQVVPSEIYGHDLGRCPQIAEQMINKALNIAEYSPLCLFARETDKEAIVTAKKELDDYKGYMIAASSLSLSFLERYRSADAFILENAPLFGFTAEYACLKNIPLYSGIRFAPLVLDGKRVKASKNKLSKTTENVRCI